MRGSKLTGRGLSVEVGGSRVKVGRFWIPDGLHIWIGYRGVHLFWHRSPYASRVMWDRYEPAPSAPSTSKEGE